MHCCHILAGKTRVKISINGHVWDSHQIRRRAEMFAKTEGGHFEYLMEILKWERHMVTSSLIIIFIAFKHSQILQYNLCFYGIYKAR